MVNPLINKQSEIGVLRHVLYVVLVLYLQTKVEYHVYHPPRISVVKYESLLSPS